jgi:FkbM family methyltransferase
VFLNNSLRKFFTLFFWYFGLNDPLVAMNTSSTKLSYLRKFKKDLNWTLVDLGSHKGEFADKVNAHLNVSQFVFVDPNEEFNDILLSKYPQAIILNYGVSLNEEFLGYKRNTKNPGQNATSKLESGQERIRSTTLQKIMDLIDSENTQIILKMDIEGNEVSVLQTLSRQVLEKLSFISIEITPISNSENFLSRLNEMIPNHFDFYRERRYGWIKISRFDAHWTDNLNLFQNLILVNKKAIEKQ